MPSQKCVWDTICARYGVAVAHSKSKDIIKAFMYEEPKPVPRIRVEDRVPVTFAIQCKHCGEPECVAACISGALYNADGNVVHDETKCVGCYSCVMACLRQRENRRENPKSSEMRPMW